MLVCEGYRMFFGSALITPWTPNIEPFRLHGTWLYKPESGCWYCRGRSFDARIVSDLVDDGLPDTDAG